MSEYKKTLKKAYHLDKYGLVALLLACHITFYIMVRCFCVESLLKNCKIEFFELFIASKIQFLRMFIELLPGF
jgi:hypothetical protein